eukprot:TRINITY_DN60422_c0_g1_i1.p1 TRINITY_DN60422_c0_g1~~TRINITY_DN60422_c0_g1_i1.p1  ORF type:complete len:190 (-),score=36.68 TRINITY_DN60422_c0_g1_i1:364-933(-)
MEQWRFVSIGTGSKIKVEALQAIVGPTIEVLPCADANSRVRPQPVGESETTTGAINRAMDAKAKFPDADAWIGIENGWWSFANAEEALPEDGSVSGELRVVPGTESAVECVNCDAAAIVVILRESPDAHTVTWSPILPIPVDKLDWERGPNEEWSILKDPHSVLTNGTHPRQWYLQEGLKAALLGGQSS